MTELEKMKQGYGMMPIMMKNSLKKGISALIYVMNII